MKSKCLISGTRRIHKANFKQNSFKSSRSSADSITENKPLSTSLSLHTCLASTWRFSQKITLSVRGEICNFLFAEPFVLSLITGIFTTPTTPQRFTTPAEYHGNHKDAYQLSSHRLITKSQL